MQICVWWSAFLYDKGHVRVYSPHPPLAIRHLRKLERDVVEWRSMISDGPNNSEPPQQSSLQRWTWKMGSTQIALAYRTLCLLIHSQEILFRLCHQLGLYNYIVSRVPFFVGNVCVAAVISPWRKAGEGMELYYAGWLVCKLDGLMQLFVDWVGTAYCSQWLCSLLTVIVLDVHVLCESCVRFLSWLFWDFVVTSTCFFVAMIIDKSLLRETSVIDL
jgi:hypothetical protein